MAEADTGTVLVAGGAGVHRPATPVRRLERAGVDVVCLDNLSTGHRAAASERFEQVDLGDRVELGRVFTEHRPAGVIHFAAKCYVGESVDDPSKYYLENVGHTWNLLEAMRASGCRDIVFSSTCATYGNPVQVPMSEDHPQEPINPYGRTKLHMEHMMQDYARAYGIRYAALRYFNAAGASPEGDLGEVHDPETHLIPLVLQVALGAREEILIFGDDYPTPDGTCIRDYIHVQDLAEAHLAALRPLAGGHGVAGLQPGHGIGVLGARGDRDGAPGDGPRHPRARRGNGDRGDPPELVSGGTAARDLLRVGAPSFRPRGHPARRLELPSPAPARFRRMSAELRVLGAGSILPRRGYGCAGYALCPGDGGGRDPAGLRARAACGPWRTWGWSWRRCAASCSRTTTSTIAWTCSPWPFARQNPRFAPAPPLELVGPVGLERLVGQAPLALGRWAVDPNCDLREVALDEAGRGGFEADGMRFRALRTGHNRERPWPGAWTSRTAAPWRTPGTPVTTPPSPSWRRAWTCSSSSAPSPTRRPCPTT